MKTLKIKDLEKMSKSELANHFRFENIKTNFEKIKNNFEKIKNNKKTR